MDLARLMPATVERVRPRLPTRANAPAASAALCASANASASASALNVAPDATATASAVATGSIASATAPGVAPSAIASASAPNFAPSATAPGVTPAAIASASALNVAPGATVPGVFRSIPPPPPKYETTWGGPKRVPPPTNFARAHQRGRGRGGRARNSAGVSQPRNSVAVSQHVSQRPSQEWGWQSAADPKSTFAPSRLSTEGSSPSTSAWSKPLPWLSTVASSSTTDTRPASAASSSTKPDSTLVPNASGSASTSSAPGVTTITDLALEPDALTSASSSTPGVATIVDAALEQDASASTPSSTLGVTTIADPSATTSAPGAGPTATAPGVAPSAITSASAPNVAPDAIAFASASAPGVSRSIPPPSTRRRRDSAPDSGGTRGWADLPMDILEMIFVKLTGPALASAQVCYTWRISAMSFPRPVVLCPVRSERMELVVPTTVIPRGANIAKSVAAEGCRSFSYITLPALSLRSHPALRLIGGSPSVPLFIDDCHRSLVAPRFVGPPGGLSNALPETLLSINLPQGVASHDIYCGIFAMAEEINKIKGVLLVTKSSIFGILVKDNRASGHWSSVQMPLVASEKDRKFIAAASFGGLTYFLDHTERLLACNMDLFGEIHTNELFAKRNGLFNLNIRTLKTWILHLSLGEAIDDSGLLCLRYEYNRPCCYRFVAYDLVVVGEGRVWRVRRELRDFCIFIGWGPGAEAFAYWHPERIGLASCFIYEAGQGMMSYRLGQVYRENAMPLQESLTWPFSIWIQHSFSVPYVLLPRRGIMAEALPPPAGDGDDADRDN